MSAAASRVTRMIVDSGPRFAIIITIITITIITIHNLLRLGKTKRSSGDGLKLSGEADVASRRPAPSLKFFRESNMAGWKKMFQFIDGFPISNIYIYMI